MRPIGPRRSMLKIENLSLYHRKDLTPIVTGLTFTLRDHERLALIGEEGNGKSTLLRCIAGDDGVQEYVEVTGRVITDRRPGYLPQELPESERALSAYEFFCESDAFFDQTPKELGELCAQLSLPGDVFYSEQRMADFSGGERVKLQLARLMLGKPDLLLLDEPSNDLDGDTVLWLEDFLCHCEANVIFVSHDEQLLSRAATGVLLLERLRHRQLPRATLMRVGYDDFVRTRADAFAHQEQVARKEREEYREKMRKYEQIRARVEHEQNAISRGNPAGGRLLKKKMHAVMATGRRFEREKENMTAMPEAEEAIFAKLSCAPLPPTKTVLDLDLPELTIEDRILARNLRLIVRGREKVAIVGRNGAGKSTLLRRIADMLSGRQDIRLFVMPQDPGALLTAGKTPVELLQITGDGEENARIRTELGSLQFTAEEMAHPCDGLSGGQKAKLMFLMMARSGANVVLLDEPTRNLSPLSGPVIRRLLSDFEGCVIAVSHDRLFLSEVCTRAVRLNESGLIPEEDGN